MHEGDSYENVSVTYNLQLQNYELWNSMQYFHNVRENTTISSKPRFIQTKQFALKLKFEFQDDKNPDLVSRLELFCKFSN